MTMDEGQQKKIVTVVRIAGIACLITGFVTFALTPIVMMTGDPFSGFPPAFFTNSARVAVTGFLLFAGGMGLMILSAVLSQKWGIAVTNLAKHSSAYMPQGHFTAQPQPAERVIIKEIVKIKCPYCGHLVENTLSTCPNCHGDM